MVKVPRMPRNHSKDNNQSILDIVRDEANAKNRSAIELFIDAVDKYHKVNLLHNLSPDKFIKYLMDRKLIVMDSDFLYYDVNCQSQLLSLFIRCKGSDLSGPATPDSEAMKPFVDTLDTIRDTRINQV